MTKHKNNNKNIKKKEEKKLTQTSNLMKIQWYIVYLITRGVRLDFVKPTNSISNDMYSSLF